jgi:hypothetical protein
VKVEVWCAGPQQKPFSFANAEKIGEVEVDPKKARRWKAGQEVTIEGIQYKVSREIFPDRNKIELWR